MRSGWWLTGTSYTSRILVEAWIATHERPTPPHALCPLSVVAERALGGQPPRPPASAEGRVQHWDPSLQHSSLLSVASSGYHIGISSGQL